MVPNKYSINVIPKTERPRERLHRYGPEAMTSSELIAIILGSGTKTVPILQLAQDILANFGSIEKLSEATIEELCKIKGLGIAKALQLKAALSLGMRVSRQTERAKYRIECPSDAFHLVRDQLEKEQRELFMVILQDVRGCVIANPVIAIGTLTNALVHPREVFYPAIRHHAASLILTHNHPSGDPTPSREDFEVTATLVEVGRVMGIPVHDHIIVGNGRYCSLREKGTRFE